jgi:arylsulfatase A-like enzyme
MKIPGLKKEGLVVDALVSHLDVFPTICELLDIEKPSFIHGKSLLPLIRGEVEQIREDLFAELNFHVCYEPMRCVRSERFKYIEFFDNHDDIIPANIDDSPSKLFYEKNGFFETKRDKEMLFDLYYDPGEKTNLVTDPRYREIYSEMSDRLLSWMKKTNDPLIAGQLMQPPGTTVFSRECIHPSIKEERERYILQL